jgi:hypothetical protein
MFERSWSKCATHAPAAMPRPSAKTRRPRPKEAVIHPIEPGVSTSAVSIEHASEIAAGEGNVADPRLAAIGFVNDEPVESVVIVIRGKAPEGNDGSWHDASLAQRSTGRGEFRRRTAFLLIRDR